MSQGNLLDPILMLGSDAQHKLSAVSEMMMETLNQEQMEDVLQLLNQTVIYMTGFEEKKQEKKRGFFAARRAELSAEDYYRTMEKRVDEISEQLRQREVILLKNRTMFEQLEQMNRAYRKELDQAIRKGRQELAEFGQKKEEEWAFQSEEVLTMDYTIQTFCTLSDHALLQCHRSYAVNPTKVTGWNNTSLFIGATEIPVGRKYLNTLKERIGI